MKVKVKYVFLITTDIISVLVVVGLCVFIATQVGVLFYRGFYCSDFHIRYPYTKLPLTLIHHLTIFYFLPLIVLVGTEAFILTRSHSKRFLTTIVHLASVFSFCMFMNLFLVFLLKKLFGVLRPNFYEVCQPDVECKFEERFEYVRNFTCTTNYGKSVWDYSRESFPSYYATLGAQSSLTVVLYFESRFEWDEKLLLKSLIQIPCLLLGTGLPMVNVGYYINHFEDVIFGFIIGIMVAYLMAFRMTDWFRKKPPAPVTSEGPSTEQVSDEETHEDPSPNKIE